MTIPIKSENLIKELRGLESARIEITVLNGLPDRIRIYESVAKDGTSEPMNAEEYNLLNMIKYTNFGQVTVRMKNGKLVDAIDPASSYIMKIL